MNYVSEKNPGIHADSDGNDLDVNNIQGINQQKEPVQIVM